MSFKFGNTDNNISKDISSVYGDDIENGIEEKMNQINNYNGNNNLSWRLGSQYKPNIAKGDMDSVDKIDFDSTLKRKLKEKNTNQNNNETNIEKSNEDEKKEEEEEVEQIINENTSNKNETQFYELNTNKLVEMIRTDYDDIYLKQNEDIKKFVDKLAKENSLLKLEVNKLKSELIKTKTKNDFYLRLYINKNEPKIGNTNNKENTKNINIVEINMERYEKEKEIIKNEYEYILLNNPSSLIAKNIKSLYDKLVRCKDDLWNYQKINIMLREENDKLKEENEYIKTNILEEKNKIIEKIIEIQTKTNSDIESNKYILLNNNNYNGTINNNNLLLSKSNRIEVENNDDNFVSPRNSNNNVYLFYINKIKSLTYEKNKLLSCNYDFFIKINDLSQAIEEKNSAINNKIQKISNLESQIINLEHENKKIKIKYDECINIINELKNTNSELIKKKTEIINYDDKLKENKYTIMVNQYENKISVINKNLNDLTDKYEKLSQDFDEMKEKYEKAINNNNIYKSDNQLIINEKNKLLKEINKLKTDLKMKEQKIIANNRENELKIQSTIDQIEDKYKNTIDYSQIKASINNVYNNVISKSIKEKNILNNSNTNISNFITTNSNEIAKLNEINKQINILFNNQHNYYLLNIENEKLKNHLKEIININLENISLMYIQKFNENFNSITIEYLILKIIDYIKVVKICFALQKIKTGIIYSEKYLNWLNEKEYFKQNNTSIKELHNEINNITIEIDNIKNTIKNNTLNLEKKFKNFLTKDEVKLEINNIQKKYEKIISGIFEYFLKYKNINDKKNPELLILQIPIKSYNLMIENNMNNITLISQSIESWNLFVSKDLDYNNNNIFQDIISLTNINKLVEYNNIEEIINTNNENINNNNETINNNNENINNNLNVNNTINSNKISDNNDNDNNNESDINYIENNKYESNKQQTYSSKSKEIGSQYSFDNKY